MISTVDRLGTTRFRIRPCGGGGAEARDDKDPMSRNRSRRIILLASFLPTSFASRLVGAPILLGFSLAAGMVHAQQVGEDGQPGMAGSAIAGTGGSGGAGDPAGGNGGVGGEPVPGNTSGAAGQGPFGGVGGISFPRAAGGGGPGSGGGGGYGGLGGGGGGGGGGGTGVTLSGGGAIGSALGGNGGAGGDGVVGGSAVNSAAGGGGGGGDGAVLGNGTYSLDVGETVTGGNGGAGGSTLPGSRFYGGGGGAGGRGVVMENGGTLTNAGTISGGNGGAAGVGDIVPHGAGGAGIVGADISIINAGAISGGMGGDGATRADAITFTGGINELEIQLGSVINGAVDATADIDSTFELSGPVSGTFDVSTIGDAAQYRGFEHFVKAGTGAWRLTGTTLALTPWAIDQGTLWVDSDSTLGDSAGGLSFNGGTLRNTEAFSIERDVALNTDGGTFQSEADLTVNGVISGVGVLTKTGAGTLTFTAANSYAGGTMVREGTLAVDGGTIDHSAGRTAIGIFDGDDASLVVKNGGAVSSGDSILGELAGASGEIVVTGRGSRWANHGGEFVIGNAGAGMMTIENRGVVTGSFARVGDRENGQGSVSVIGEGSKWVSTNDIVIGNSATGSLAVLEGGTVSSRIGYIGALVNGVGTAVVDGAGSSWIGEFFLIGSFQTSSGTLTIADGGQVTSRASIILGLSPQTTGVINIGAPADQPAAAPGGLNTPSIRFNEGKGTINFNHTATDYVFGANLESDATGTSAINHLAGTTRLTGDGSHFTGTTTVSGGTLIVDGALGGTIDVLSGARLEGTGTVGTTTIATGGTIAPGHSPGTLTVDGDITFTSGSTYEVDITPALESDLIEASGQARIEGGTVHVVKTPGTYTPGSRWTIIGADGGVMGEFDTLTQNMPFVELSLNYEDPSRVYLDVARNAVSFCEVAWTFNQCSTGDGLESTGPGNPVYDIVAAIPDEDGARQALDALSGEIYGSVKGILLEDSRFPREAALDRTRSAFAGVAAPSLPVMGYGPEESREALAQGKSVALALAPADTDRLVLWVRGFSSWGEWENDGNAAQFERSIGGGFIGADAPVGGWRIGLLAGYSRSSFHLDDRASSGSSDDYHLGLYGGTEWGNVGLRLGAAYAWHEIETHRSMAFPGFADGADASYDARTAQAFGEIGYRIDRDSFAFEPFARLAYARVRTDGFAEDGGAAALSVRGGTTDATFTTLGLRASTEFRLGTARATARGMVGWRHAFGDVTSFSTHAFAGGDAFAVAGTPIAENALVLEAGLDVVLSPSAVLGVSYSGQIAGSSHDHGVRANLTVTF